MAESTLHLIAVGDLSFNGSYHSILEMKGPAYPFSLVRDEWQSADLRFGNLESPISSHERVSKAKLTLRASTLSAQALHLAGFDCIALANNHMMDFGAQGLVETCDQLDSKGIAHVGAGRNLQQAMAPTVLIRNRQSIGVFAFCDVEQVSDLYASTTSAGVAPAELSACKEAIGAIRGEVDWIVVQMHWGSEMCQLPSPKQRQWARDLIGAGADLIIGHHPHVWQPIEHIGNGAVAYSLGDFSFSNTFWHGVNGGGKPFLGHYAVHGLSRDTGWLQVELKRGKTPSLTFHPAFLGHDLTIVPQRTKSRHDQWQRLNVLLQEPNYAQAFNNELSVASEREKWRMNGRRPILRLKLKLLEYGYLPAVNVEPDGTSWRGKYGRSNRTNQQAQIHVASN